jgi:hypothetical protein
LKFKIRDLHLQFQIVNPFHSKRGQVESGDANDQRVGKSEIRNPKSKILGFVFPFLCFHDSIAGSAL